ncbi:ribonuclease R [Rhodobacteraceae bacterium RKSG542]|uniref:ribonuclease R n=1 Tax=Pseudovibrio flavus TaxID=2529854 RepID=UPI0012BCD66E|nr:ribonuclease R [Pseudovibrio flavus]MTI16376.1 ribonuclease R [Pseudovibrio flavus]
MPKKKASADLPSRDDILAFIAQNPGSAGKREISKHFKITGANRIALKRILKELAADGLVQGSRKALIRPGDLPTVFVANINARNTDGEFLAVPHEWNDEDGPAPKVVILPNRRKGTEKITAGLGDRVLLRLADQDAGPEANFAARIIRRLDKNSGNVIAILRIHPETKAAWLEPVDRKQDPVDVNPMDLNEAKDGDLVRAQIGATGRYKTKIAKITERIGSMNSEKAISEIALYTHNIPTVFPDRVIAEAESAGETKLGKREDWRSIPLITIDPADAKDHDDAVYAQIDDDPENLGGVVVYVAIADVAAYVTPGSAMDREAVLRGNSVYFPDRVIPMLPERISNDLCSLREKEERPAMGVRMVFGSDGRKRKHSFHRVLMRSAAKLSYQQAQRAIEGQTDEKTETLLDGVLRPLWEAYAVLKKGRDKRAPLELNIPERKIKLKADGTVDQIFVPERLDAHKLIEEFMIQANVCAAETLEDRRVPLLYRIHDASTPEKLQNLRDFLSTLAIKVPHQGGLRASVFNNILDRVKDTANEPMVNEVVLRSQAQAEYHPDNIGHFGLNLRRYAHFTSPIRRYADLIVHRALITALGLGKDGLPFGYEEQLEQVAGEISAAERRAMTAERETIDRLIALWLCDQIGAQFRGRIAGVTKSGLFVRLDDTGADGFIPASTLGKDYYAYEESAHALIGRATGETYQLGDAVEVKLAEAAPYAGSLRFEMESKGKHRSEALGKVATPHRSKRSHRGDKPLGLRKSKSRKKR